MKDKIEQITQRIVEGADSIETVILQDVEVQANGIIRNSKGRLIARLVDSVDYEGEHIKGLNPMQKLDIEQSARKVANCTCGKCDWCEYGNKVKEQSNPMPNLETKTCCSKCIGDPTRMST